MVATLLNLFFGCRHKKLTRPITPVRRSGAQTGGAYVACLGCGKQFHYDAETFRMGRAISDDDSVRPSSCYPLQAQN
jgi:hypothetical protein